MSALSLTSICTIKVALFVLALGQNHVSFKVKNFFQRCFINVCAFVQTDALCKTISSILCSLCCMQAFIYIIRAIALYSCICAFLHVLPAKLVNNLCILSIPIHVSSRVSVHFILLKRFLCGYKHISYHIEQSQWTHRTVNAQSQQHDEEYNSPKC